MTPLTRKGLSLAIGAAGGAVFAYLGAPLAWMLGAMLTSALINMTGTVHLVAPQTTRMIMIGVIGVLLGGMITPEIIADITNWWRITLVVLCGCTAMTIVGWLICRTLGRFSRDDALLASMPGGITEMILICNERGGNVPLISLTHAVRIMVMVLVIPTWFRVIEGFEVPVLPNMEGDTGTWRDILILIGCVLVGLFGGKAIHLPAAALTGPMILSALVHLAGITTSVWPVWVVAVAQVVIGVGIGSRFADIPRREIQRGLVISISVALAMTAVAVSTALIFSPFATISSQVLILAIVPGGFIEMGLIALSVGAAPALVSTMHTVRLLAVVLTTSSLIRLIPKENPP